MHGPGRFGRDTSATPGYLSGPLNEGEMTMKLYGHPMSTCTRKVLCLLAEKNHKADFELVDIM